MPIYEYACESCGHRFEITQRFSDAPIEICPECGLAVRRVFHPAGIIFKGSGFYINDSKKNGSSSVPAGKSASDSATKPESESSTESATKTESVKEPVSSTSTEKS